MTDLTAVSEADLQARLYPNSPPPPTSEAPAVQPVPQQPQPQPQPKPLAAEAPAEPEADADADEGHAISEAQAARFAEVAERLGLEDAELVATEVQQHVETARRQWVEQAKQDPVLAEGGFAQNVERARAFVTEFGDRELKSMLDTSGLGDNPVLMRLVLRAARALDAARATKQPTPQPRQQAKPQPQQPAREQPLDDAAIAAKLYGKTRSPAPRGAAPTTDDAKLAAKLYPSTR